MDIQTVQMFRSKLRVIERELGQQLKEDTTCCGVSMAQCHAIMELGFVESMSIRDLAMLLKLDNSTLSRTIDGLVKIGLVDRSINPEDRRYMQIRLTDQGKKVFQKIDKGSNALYLSVFEKIPSRKHDQVLESLTLFAEAFQEVKQADALSCYCIPEIQEDV